MFISSIAYFVLLTQLIALFLQRRSQLWTVRFLTIVEEMVLTLAPRTPPSSERFPTLQLFVLGAFVYSIGSHGVELILEYSNMSGRGTDRSHIMLPLRMGDGKGFSCWRYR